MKFAKLFQRGENQILFTMEYINNKPMILARVEIDIGTGSKAMVFNDDARGFSDREKEFNKIDEAIAFVDMDDLIEKVMHGYLLHENSATMFKA